jgi:hypothetical protein
MLLVYQSERNVESFVNVKTRERQENYIETRNVTWGNLTEVGRSRPKKIICDAAKLLNKAPDKIRTVKTLTTAKRQSESIASHWPFRTIKINAWNMLGIFKMFVDCIFRIILVLLLYL